MRISQTLELPLFNEWIDIVVEYDLKKDDVKEVRIIAGYKRRDQVDITTLLEHFAPNTIDDLINGVDWKSKAREKEAYQAKKKNQV